MRAALSQQELQYETEIRSLKETIERQEKTISTIRNMEMQLDSLQSEVKQKTENAQRLQREAWAKDNEIESYAKVVNDLKAENSRLL